MALQDFFVWGEGGSKKTPEQLDRERRLAQAMIASGVDMSPVGHWTQGAARMANALVGNIKQARADKAERAGIEGAAKKFGSLDLANLLSGGAVYPSSVAAGGSPTSAAATGTVPQGKFNFGENADALRNGIVETAQAIGADPVDLATAISYETAGTFDPTKAGPRTQYGQHRGLIQFGEPQAEKYGVDWNNPLASQLGPNGAVANYFRSSGFKPGMSGLDLYSTINAGSPGRYSASDANNGGAPGDVRDKWENQMAGHRQKAMALLGGGASAAPVQVASNDPSIGLASAVQHLPSQPVDMAGAAQTMPDRLGIPAGVTMASAAQPIGGATIRAGDYDPALHRGNAPADGAYASIDSYTRPTAPAPSEAEALFGPNADVSEADIAFAKQATGGNAAAGAIDQIAPRDMAAVPTPSAAQPQAAGPSAELLRQNDIAFGGALAPQGSAPVQVADASGYFPAAPSADRAPIMGSYAAPAAQRQGGGNIAQLLEAASDPWMNESQRGMIGMALEHQLRQNDPMRALQAQKLQLEMDALRAKPQTEYGFTTLPDGTVLRTDKRSGNAEPIYSAGQKPTSDMQEYNFAVSQGFKGSFADYQQVMKKAGASSTNVSVGEGDNFYEALDKKNADTFAALSDTGMQARSKLAQVERLGGLMQASPTGAAAALKLAAGEYGIKTDGLDDLQAAQALINELVPQQRQPGSGPMSDADLALFKQSLPRIINTPDGNQLILDTMRGITQYQIQMGDIADQVANREISAAEGRNRIKNLKNPLEGFRTSTKDKTTGKSGVSGNRLRFNPQTGDFE
ncbi:flagellar biosynthesis protein FlgJ [Brucella intermedia]|uniref:flagellar biosynthesis protein FlgJ n=1 Tax=Brucella intermedia TaxID=94625 RepID=UPI0031F2E068